MGSAERLHEHVAVPLREQPDGRAADVPQPRRSERRDGSDQLDAPVPRAQRAREDHGAVSVSPGRSRAGREGNAPRAVGAVRRVARQVREGSLETRAEEEHDRSSAGGTVTPMSTSEDLEAALEGNSRARANYDAVPPFSPKAYVHW